MAKQFDPKQQVVLDCIKEKQLVSAGAGSGKTTVMIEKITRLIVSGNIKPSEIIVLTFTNLAGKEMKERLSKSLHNKLQLATDEEEIKQLLALIDEVELSAIDTIDGFCSKMVKKFFYKLDLSPNMNIATGLSSEYYINKSLDDTINNAFEKNKNELIELSDCFEKNARSLDSLKKNLLSTFNFIMAQKDYREFLENAKKEYTGLFKSADYINEHLINAINENLIDFNAYLNDLTKYEKFFGYAKNFLNHVSLISKQNSILENIKVLTTLPTPARNRIKDEDKYSYEIIKTKIDNIKEITEEFKFLKDYENYQNSNQHFNYFIKLLEDFIENYQNIKKEYNILDFSDLERMFLSLLSFDDVRTEIHNQYKYIFVDEYQDINPMQDEIITSLKSINSKIFFVGDVKQSIYGFRQSLPELFLNLYNKYKIEEDTSQAFNMNINFRSNPKILKFNNVIFNKLMTKEKTDIDYLGEAQFEPKREDFEQPKDSIEIAIFNSSKTTEQLAEGIYSVENHKEIEKISAVKNECQFIADKILELVSKDFYDAEIKAKRKMEFTDIAILSRGVNDDKTHILVETLRKNNIPINISNNVVLSECEAINLIYQILKVINNTSDDAGYVSLMLTNLTNFTLDEIYEISLSSKENTFLKKLYYYSENYHNTLADKVKYLFNLIEEIKLNSLEKSNLELINMLLNNYHLKQYILNSDKGETELSALTNFLSNITEKENREPLEKFLTFIELNFKSKTEYSQSDNLNSVTIQTIHASKGLEYPVVILFNSSKPFKPNNDKDDINFDNELGIGMQHFDLKQRTKVDSLTKFAIKLKNKIKAYKEELRLLYVATTRPKNKLIITGCVKFDNIINGKLKNNNYLELIYSVFENSLNIENEKTELEDCVFYQFYDYEKQKFDIDKDNAKIVQYDKNDIEFDYPYLELSQISLKNNVTAISRTMENDYNILPKTLNIKENLNTEVDSSAEIGTKYHNILSKLNFNEDFSDVNDAEIDNNLIKLAYNKIKPYCKNAIKITQEGQFMMYVKYSDIYPESDITERVLVQGVVDLMIETNEGFILIDYKYSKLNIHKLREKYDNQLKLYKLAIEKAYKKPVLKSLIYQINTGEIQ